MKTFATIDPAAFKNLDSARSAAFRKKGAAVKAGWTDVKTMSVKQDGQVVRLEIVGAAPKAEPTPTPAEPAPATPTKAKKKAPSTPEPKPAPKAEPKVRDSKTLNRDGQPRISTGKAGVRPVGRTTGVGIEQTWGIIFEREEKKAESKRLNDLQITDEMRDQFPGRNSRVFARVAEVRTKWRKGLFGYQKRGASASEG